MFIKAKSVVVLLKNFAPKIMKNNLLNAIAQFNQVFLAIDNNLDLLQIRMEEIDRIAANIEAVIKEKFLLESNSLVSDFENIIQNDMYLHIANCCILLEEEGYYLWDLNDEDYYPVPIFLLYYISKAIFNVESVYYEFVGDEILGNEAEIKPC